MKKAFHHTRQLCHSRYGHCKAGSIENMERERALIIGQIRLSGHVQPDALGTYGIRKRRMADLERIALNDKTARQS